MKIGIIRHFKVDCKPPFLLNSDEFAEWAARYDIAPVFPFEIDLKGVGWQSCYASDLPRAITTAEAAFKGEITISPLLREVPLSPVFKTRLRLPFRFWLIAARVAWFFSHRSQEEGRAETRMRIRKFFAEFDYEKNGSTLLVCHRFFIHSLHRRLRADGFDGERIFMAKNGILYLFERGTRGR